MKDKKVNKQDYTNFERLLFLIMSCLTFFSVIYLIGYSTNIFPLVKSYWINFTIVISVFGGCLGFSAILLFKFIKSFKKEKTRGEEQ